MLDVRHSSRRFSADRLLAFGASLAIHGIAVAAVMAALAGGGTVVDSSAPPTIALTLEWIAAPTSETGQSASAADTPSDSTSTSKDSALSMNEPAIDTSERRVESSTPITDVATPDVTASTTTEPTQIPPPPTRKPKTVAIAKAQPTTPQLSDDGEDGQQNAVTIATNTDSQRSAASSDVATTGSSPARHAGERSAWSVTTRMPPAYPMSARRRGIEGEVELRVDVDSDGRPRLVTIARSSGDRQLDGAAARAVEQWRFAVAAPMAIAIPIQFRLNTGDAAASQP